MCIRDRSEVIDRTRRVNVLGVSARPMFAAVVDALDQAIGQVLKTLEDEGIEEETLVLFSSDNGGAAYAGGGADNFPLRGGKGDTYEGGIRVIAAMKWKGVIKENSNMDQVMTVMDIFPTLSSAAKVNMNVSKKINGRNMWPAIAENKRIKLQDDIFFASETPNYGEFHTTVFLSLIHISEPTRPY